MKLIIDVDEQEYKTILANAKLYKDKSWGSADVWDAILNGIPYEPKGDLISREALKKELAKCGYDIADFGSLFFIIDNAPTVDTTEQEENAYNEGYAHGLETKRPQGEWIPVSERLPERANQSYLVTVDYGDGLISSCQRFFFGEGIGWNDGCVIAWQPLPKPYESEADNG